MMEINETKQLINALSRLCGKDNIYEFERRFERDEEDELLEVMPKAVGEMWFKYHKEELIKQREIGQQIIIIRIVHDDNDMVSRGGFSHFDRSEIAEWMRKSEEEVEYFLNDIAALDEFNICVDAAFEYANKLPADAYVFFLSTFRKHGYLYIESMLGKKKAYDPYSDGIEDLASINARKIIDKGIHVDEEIQSAARFEDSLKFYFKFYISRIMDVISEGYEWDVVCEMLGEDKEFTDLIKPLVDNGIIQEHKA